MSQPREYDPEIKDIADYVANKAVDSDLAVSLTSIFLEVPLHMVLLVLLVLPLGNGSYPAKKSDQSWV